MNKAAIKNFAVWARRKLIDDIKQKAYEIGVTENQIKEPQIISSDTIRINNIQLKKHQINQRKKLIEKIREKGYEQVVEEAAYTWFNRFIAIRFMEVNGYLPTGVRVLSSADPDKLEPDIIKEALNVDLDLDEEIIYSYEDAHDREGLFKYLLVKQCNALHDIMPVVFEEIADYTEMLLPDNLLQEDSVIRRLVESIEDTDWTEQVEIIGWLYQYYISEKKGEVFEGLKKNIKITKENIPAATQLFTPDWIVKYMVENSLGRLWLQSHPNEELKEKWKYYLDDVKQETEVENQMDKIGQKGKIERPEDIKFLDPCMGSGHILVYAFEVFYDIYKSEGYSERDIPGLILGKNLYGLEIDDRAAQIAYFAVMMKARSKSRRIFRENIQLNLCSIKESNDLSKEAMELLVSPGEARAEKGVKREEAEHLIDVFNDAKEYGSILDIKGIDFHIIQKRLKELERQETLDILKLQQRNIILGNVPALIKQGSIMSQRYDVVCTNPPYMGRSNISSSLAGYIDRHYPLGKNDLYAVFIGRCCDYCKTNRFVAMITQHSWMFLSSFELLRQSILESKVIRSMVHLGTRAFEDIGGEVVQTTSFILQNSNIGGYKGMYVRLTDYDDAKTKENQFFNKDNRFFRSSQEDFKAIAGSPIAYWASENLLHTFKTGVSVDAISDFTGSQNITANNNKYLRMFWEVDKSKIENKRWVFYAKGGEYRKHYGNLNYVVDWSGEARYFYKSNKTSNLLAEKYWYQEGITYNGISVKGTGFRYLPKGCVFDKGGPTICYVERLYYVLALLNSKVASVYLGLLNPTINIQIKDVKSIPVVFDDRYIEAVETIENENIYISRIDWDSYETSWEFRKHPIIAHKNDLNTIEQALNKWINSTEERFMKLKANEEKLNEIFIEVYGLKDELAPEIENKDVTVRIEDRERDIRSFISYAVGCMFGRYSLDEDALIYAGGEFEMDRYKSFKVSEDNIIPILDDEYFENDILNRFVEFVRMVFGPETLEENLDYIAETLGRKAAETARQTIRRYFLKDFYKDHTGVYQRRPIYWLFDSGKDDGFKALIYMHRYDTGTAARVRIDYLHRLQKKYDAEISRMDIFINSDVSEREKAAARKRKEKIQRQMQECMEYDQVIAHAANQKITIDLDDGVAVNYAKLQNVQIPQGEGRKPLTADLLARI